MKFEYLCLAFILTLFAYNPAWSDSGKTRVEIEAGFSYEALDKGFADWRSYYLEASKKLAARKTIYGTLRETKRFSIKDRELLTGIYYPLNRRWTALLETKASPSHHVLPVFSLLGQLQLTLGSGWNVHSGVRLTEYPNTGTTLGILTLERYRGNYRAAYTLYPGHVQGAGSATSHRFHANYYYGDRGTIGLSCAFGTEVEKSGSNSVIFTDVRALSLSGRHWFSPDRAVTYEIGVHGQGDSYTRKGVRIGFRHLF